MREAAGESAGGDRRSGREGRGFAVSGMSRGLRLTPGSLLSRLGGGGEEGERGRKNQPSTSATFKSCEGPTPAVQDQ